MKFHTLVIQYVKVTVYKIVFFLLMRHVDCLFPQKPYVLDKYCSAQFNEIKR